MEALQEVGPSGLTGEGTASATLPVLSADVLCAILHALHPRCWCSMARVSHAWRQAVRLCWESVTELSLIEVEGQAKAVFRQLDALSSPTADRTPDFESADACLHGLVWLSVAQSSDGEMSVEVLERLLELFNKVHTLKLRDVRLTGRPRLGYSALPGQDMADPTLALLVHVLAACPMLESLSLQRCTGTAFETSPAFPRRARGGRPMPSFARLRALQLSSMDGPAQSGARWLAGCLPSLAVADLSWSDTDLGSLLVLPASVESVNLIGCFAVSEARVRELVRSPSHRSLTHLWLPTGIPLSVALETCRELPRLRTLSCSGAYSDAAGPHIVIEHAELASLNLSALLLNHRCCLELACPKLASLDLRQDVFVFEGICGLLLREAPLLEHLDLRWNARLELRPTAPMPRLRAALLEGCATLSARMLYDLVQSAPHLEELEMGECDGLRNEPAVFSLAFAYALRSSPGLRYTLPSGVKGVGLDVPSSALDHDFP